MTEQEKKLILMAFKYAEKVSDEEVVKTFYECEELGYCLDDIYSLIESENPALAGEIALAVEV
jgi:hypothetical protein